MIVGLVPDLVQGAIKAFWVLSGQTRQIGMTEIQMQTEAVE
jgi:hypothetical protein